MASLSTLTTSSSRAAITRSSLSRSGLAEMGAFGYRRASMEGVARRAGVSRATVYAHWRSKQELFRGLVQELHDEHVRAMEAASDRSDLHFEERMLAVLEARFLRFVELVAESPHAIEFYDLHGRLCGDIAQASQKRSEEVLARLLREAVAAGEADLAATGLSPAQVAGVLFACAHGAKGEDPSQVTPEDFRLRLAQTIRVVGAGLLAPGTRNGRK